MTPIPNVPVRRLEHDPALSYPACIAAALRLACAAAPQPALVMEVDRLETAAASLACLMRAAQTHPDAACIRMTRVGLRAGGRSSLYGGGVPPPLTPRLSLRLAAGPGAAMEGGGVPPLNPPA